MNSRNRKENPIHTQALIKRGVRHPKTYLPPELRRKIIEYARKPTLGRGIRRWERDNATEHPMTTILPVKRPDEIPYEMPMVEHPAYDRLYPKRPGVTCKMLENKGVYVTTRNGKIVEPIGCVYDIANNWLSHEVGKFPGRKRISGYKPQMIRAKPTLRNPQTFAEGYGEHMMPPLEDIDWEYREHLPVSIVNVNSPLSAFARKFKKNKIFERKMFTIAKNQLLDKKITTGKEKVPQRARNLINQYLVSKFGIHKKPEKKNTQLNKTVRTEAKKYGVRITYTNRTGQRKPRKDTAIKNEIMKLKAKKRR